MSTKDIRPQIQAVHDKHRDDVIALLRETGLGRVKTKNIVQCTDTDLRPCNIGRTLTVMAQDDESPVTLFADRRKGSVYDVTGILEDNGPE